MILFNNPSTSTVTTALVLSLILLSLIISCFLNPTVFLYNRKKTSIAGLLFCIISATDFTVCFSWTICLFSYAATIDLEKMSCLEKESVPKQPQNCYTTAKPINYVVTNTMASLNCIMFTTTGVLAIVRSIQIKYPFYPIKKSCVLIILVLFYPTQLVLVTFISWSPLSEKRFHPAFLIEMAVNPFGLEGELENVQKYSNLIASLPLGVLQLVAVFASVVTAFTLFQERYSGGPSDLTKSRIAGAVKVLLTNSFSLIYGILFGTPIFLLFHHGSSGEITAEREGWSSFFVTVMLPVISSAWNPIVFVSLTPKSRETLRSLFVSIKRNSEVQPAQI